MPAGGRRELANASQSSRPGTKHDAEAAYDAERSTRLRHRFQDAINSVIQDGRRSQLQDQIINDWDTQKLERYRKSDDELKALKSKKVRKYYEEQNELLNDWLEIDTIVKHLTDDIVGSFDPRDDDLDGIPEGGALQGYNEQIEPFLPPEEREKRRMARKYAMWAININVIANIALLAAKVIAVFASNSLSLIASLVDSALDLLCTLIVWTTNKLVVWKIHSLRQRFPVGRRRLEPIGILVFSVIMIVSFLQILQESVEKLMGSSRDTALLPASAIVSMAVTIVVKGIIGVGCVKIQTTQVQALAQDCKTDVIFNTFSLLFPLVGNLTSVWWLDPAGAGILSLYIIYDWAKTCLENVARLTGIAAEDRVLKKIYFLVWRFESLVEAYKRVTAYYAGDGIWVEVDILLDEKTPLESAHDIAETIQYCLEGLQEIDRAFVTIDYTRHGPSGHVTA